MSDDLVAVAFANEGVEAQMIQGLLENAGIKSLLRPSGLDGSQGAYIGIRSGYGGGPQRVMVRPEQEAAARKLLDETLVEGDGEEFEGPVEG